MSTLTKTKRQSVKAKESEAKGLHSRQLRALELLLIGKSRAEVGKELGISAYTLDNWLRAGSPLRLELQRTTDNALMALQARTVELAESAYDAILEILQRGSERARLEAAKTVLNTVKREAQSRIIEDRLVHLEQMIAEIAGCR